MRDTRSVFKRQTGRSTNRGAVEVRHVATTKDTIGPNHAHVYSEWCLFARGHVIRRIHSVHLFRVFVARFVMTDRKILRPLAILMHSIDGI